MTVSGGKIAYFFFCKQKTAYEVRISDCSSDVCSSDLSSLRFVVHAAAPCPQHIKRQMIEWWGPVIHEFYGSTEVRAVAACTAHEWLERPGTVGRSLAGRSEEHTSELQSLMRISYAVFCLKQPSSTTTQHNHTQL